MAILKEPGLGLRNVTSELEAAHGQVDPDGNLEGALFLVDLGEYESLYRVVQMEPFTIQQVCGVHLPTPYVRGLIPEDIREEIRLDLEGKRKDDAWLDYHDWETELRKIHGLD